MANGSRFALSLLTAAGLAFTACAPAAAPEASAPAAPPATNNWEQTVAAAKKEGKVVVVSHTDLYYREGIAAFQKAYPEIQVEHVAIRPSEFAPKLLTEQQNGLYSYDVWLSPTSNMVTVALPAGALQSMDPYLKLPEVVDPSNYRGGKLLWATTSGNSILLDRGTVDDNVWVNQIGRAHV